MSKQKIPKDLGVKVGTENEVFWTNVKEAAEQAVKDAEKTIMLQSAVRQMAEIELQKEKALNSSTSES